MSDTNSPVDTREWLMFARQQATVLSEAYRLRLVGKLWWANVIFVVVPAVFGTAAAALAAAASSTSGDSSRVTLIAAFLAGGAAVLTAVHKALNCDAYQAECLRLSQAFQSIRIRTEAMLAESKSNPDPRGVNKLAAEYARLTESAKAVLPDVYIQKATDQTGYKRYPDLPDRPAPRRWWSRLYSEPSARLTAR
jgi:hypothetical protein